MNLKFFELAKDLTLNSDHHTHQLASVIVHNNRIVSWGWNKLSSDPKTNHPFKSKHSEYEAIKKCNYKKIDKCSIYVFRQNKLGELANSFPCVYCYELIKRCGIKTLYYTCDGGYKQWSVK